MSETITKCAVCGEDIVYVYGHCFTGHLWHHIPLGVDHDAVLKPDDANCTSGPATTEPPAPAQPDSPARKAPTAIAAAVIWERVRFGQWGPDDISRAITEEYAAQTAELESLRKQRDSDRRMLYIANDRAIEINRLTAELESLREENRDLRAALAAEHDTMARTRDAILMLLGVDPATRAAG